MNTSINVDAFHDIMKTRITECVIFFVILFVLYIGFMAFLLWYYIWNKKDEATTDSPENIADNKKENRRTILYAIFMTTLAVCALQTGIKDYLNYSYDMNNDAYVVLKGDFVIKSATYGWGRFSDNVYTLVFEEDGHEVEFDVNTKHCAVDTGTYTDAVLVYSSRAKVVLAIEGHPK